MLVIRGLDRVLGDLTKMGYDCRWGVLGADDAGAPHKRKRIWLLGRNSNHVRCVGDGREIGEVQNQNADTNRICQDVAYPTGGQSGQQATRNRRKSVIRGSKDVADAESVRGRSPTNGAARERIAAGGTWWLQDPADVGDTTEQGLSDRRGAQVGHSGEAESQPKRSSSKDRESRPTQPAVGRVANGVAHRVDRLKAIGNGQVPAVAALAWRILSMPNTQLTGPKGPIERRVSS